MLFLLLIVSNKCLGLRNGVLVAVPILEEHALEESSIEEAITLALLQAKFVLSDCSINYLLSQDFLFKSLDIIL